MGGGITGSGPGRLLRLGLLVVQVSDDVGEDRVIIAAVG